MPEALGTVVFGVGIAGFILFSISIPIVVSYFLDRRAHEGVDWFRRRRVLAQGQQAEAGILSATLLVDVNVGAKYQGAYSIVYDVRPAGAAPFRARGIEVMYFSEADDNGLKAGGLVRVRFDPSDQTVVLVRVDGRQAKHEADAQRRAKEAALLRG